MHPSLLLLSMIVGKLNVQCYVTSHCIMLISIFLISQLVQKLKEGTGKHAVFKKGKYAKTIITLFCSSHKLFLKHMIHQCFISSSHVNIYHSLGNEI
jgi:hypothetical protein